MVVYLAGGDLAAYGVASATAPQIQAASRIIDSYCDRPESLVWTPGADGQPAYMAGLNPRLALTLGSSIAPGQNVVAPVANASLVRTGDVLVADRANTAETEALVVSDVSAADSTLTFQSVAYAHSSGAALEAGLVLEESGTPTPQGLVRLPTRPVARVLSASVPARHALWILLQASPAGPDGAFVTEPFNMQLFTDLRPRLRQDVTIRYLAGFAQANIPDAVKQACANLVLAMENYPELVGNVKSLAAGGTDIVRFGPTLMDGDTMRLLGAYRASGGILR